MSSCLEARLPDWTQAQLPEPSVPLNPTPHPQGPGSSSLPVFPQWRVSLKAGHGKTGSVPTLPNFLYGCSEKEVGKNPSCSRPWTLVAGSWLSLKTKWLHLGRGWGDAGRRRHFHASDRSIQAWFPEERPQADFGCAVPPTPLSTPQARSCPTAAKPRLQSSCSWGRSLAPSLEERD